MKIISNGNCPLYTYDGIGYIVVGKEFVIKNFKPETINEGKYYLSDKLNVMGYSFTETSNNEYCFIELQNFEKYITVLSE